MFRIKNVKNVYTFKYLNIDKLRSKTESSHSGASQIDSAIFH